MKKAIFLFLLIVFFLTYSSAQTKNFYSTNGGEIIFSFADVEYQNISVPTNMRFTLFLHLGQFFHYDYSNNLGMYSGLSMRNIGFITEQNGIKDKRRSYSLGIPLAMKIGNFNKNIYLYGGGEYELMFHYKHKRFVGNTKQKHKEWFSDRTNRLVPSIFGGIQFPGGINLKFKYYLNDFLNKDVSVSEFGETVDYSDFNKTQIFYIALTFNIKPKNFKDFTKPDNKMARYSYTGN